MKILQINASYKPAYIYGGPTMSVSKLSEELVKSGEEVEVISTTANGETELDVKAGEKTMVDGVPVTYFSRITKGNSHLSPALLIFLWKILRKRAIASEESSAISAHLHICPAKLVHIHAWWNMVSVCSSFIALLLSKPVILSPRGTLSDYSFVNRKSILKNVFHQIVGKALLKRCHFHVTSEKEKLDILNIIAPKSITVIANFVKLGPAFEVSHPATSISPLTTYNLPLETQNSELPTPNFKLIFLSRIEEKKGLDILFLALKQVEIPYHLTIAGTGKPEYILILKSLADALGLSAKITWIGQQDNDLKFDVLSGHDLMILPSHDESFANVVIESLSVGTPVLLSSKVGLADYVLSNDFGWVYRSCQDQLAQSINHAFASLKRRNAIRNEAPVKIRIDFDHSRLIESYLKMYNKIA